MKRQLNTTKRKLGDVVKFPTYSKSNPEETETGTIVQMEYFEEIATHIFEIHSSGIDLNTFWRAEKELIEK